MAEAVATEQIPLVTGADGVMRVRGTRVTLDSVVAAFKDGATAEEIAQQYPSLSLSDIYATISFYLQNKYAVDKYLGQRAKKAKAVREENEKRFDQRGIRERLLARKSK